MFIAGDLYEHEYIKDGTINALINIIKRCQILKYLYLQEIMTHLLQEVYMIDLNFQQIYI